MGYTTTFDGVFHFNKIPSINLIDKINNFSKQRHNYEDYPSIWDQWVIGKQYAKAGEYGVNCVITDDRIIEGKFDDTKYEKISGELVLGWDGYEKFYEAEGWLMYIIDNFLKPEGYSITGEVAYQGERDTDNGILAVVDNEITNHMGPDSY